MSGGYGLELKSVCQIESSEERSTSKGSNECARTGRPSQPSSTPSSDSQLSAPMVGRMREAICRTVSRYKRATRTGFGSVFVTKLRRVWKWGRMLGRSGALRGMSVYSIPQK